MDYFNNKDNLIKVGITHGDFNGISYEIILKIFQDTRIFELFTPVLYGSSKIASYYRKALNLSAIPYNNIRRPDQISSKKLNIVNCHDEEVKIEIGKLSPKAGELALAALELAIKDIRNNNIDVLVTAPINKQNIQSDSFSFPGHTEYLASKANASGFLMMMVSETLKIGFVTGHTPIKDIRISSSTILEKIEILNQSLKNDFSIIRPKIAVLGLNPHAGDNGLIGEEDNMVIAPAIEEAKNNNIMAFGPFSADGFFGSGNFAKFDGILAMYHDQGMIPFKIISFDQGANFTAGLPFVRTSPAHGTAFDIAGKNLASPDSLSKAIYLALDIFRNRAMNKELNANPLAIGKQVESTPDNLLDIEGDEDISNLYEN